MELDLFMQHRSSLDRNQTVHIFNININFLNFKISNLNFWSFIFDPIITNVPSVLIYVNCIRRQSNTTIVDVFEDCYCLGLLLLSTSPCLWFLNFRIGTYIWKWIFVWEHIPWQEQLYRRDYMPLTSCIDSVKNKFIIIVFFYS
jgi:hypothetical protein